MAQSLPSYVEVAPMDNREAREKSRENGGGIVWYVHKLDDRSKGWNADYSFYTPFLGVIEGFYNTSAFPARLRFAIYVDTTTGFIPPSEELANTTALVFEHVLELGGHEFKRVRIPWHLYNKGRVFAIPMPNKDDPEATNDHFGMIRVVTSMAANQTINDANMNKWQAEKHVQIGDACFAYEPVITAKFYPTVKPLKH